MNLKSALMPPTDITIWQDNVITKARYEMTSLEKNILYMILAQIKKDDTAETLYYVHAKELMQLTGETILYGDFIKATRKLVQRYFEAELPNGDFLQATFVSSARYLKGQGIIELELSRNVRPFFVELKEKFTTFQLHTALTLNSKYAKRMYELFSLYKGMKDPSFRVNLADLKRQLGIIDEKGKDRYEKWTHFKKAVLDPTEKEIMAAGELSFTYTPIKKGRAVAQIEFVVRHEREAVQVHYDGDKAAVFGRLINQFKLRKDQARKIMDMYSLDEIHKRLYDIHLKVVNKELQNVGAYTAKTFGVGETEQKGKKN